MNKIWAPWRKQYILSTRKKTKTCIFCVAKKKTASDRKNHVLRRSKHSFSILNRFPYNNGHVMIAPYRHVRSLALLKKEEVADFMSLVCHTEKKIDRCLRPDGYNMGLNIGRIAGAGFPGHVHIHIVPRWKGDTNFMPVLADTKVVSYSLADMYDLLKG